MLCVWSLCPFHVHPRFLATSFTVSYRLIRLFKWRRDERREDTGSSCHLEENRMCCHGSGPYFRPLPKWITHNQEEVVNSPTWCTLFRHAGRLIFTISPHLLLATCDSDKIAIKICTSCAALHNYCKLLPTHCMKHLSMSVNQVAHLNQGTQKERWPNFPSSPPPHHI